jgi:transcription elongation factor GreA
MAKTPMTTRGAELLRAELQRLRAVERPNVITAIAEARAHGDLSENAEYDAARERQGFIEGRISDGRCVFGATVDLEEQGKQATTYQIVGDDEADIKQGRISINSPIARALIGKEAGDRVDVQTPGGVKHYEILDVRYE